MARKKIVSLEADNIFKFEAPGQEFQGYYLGAKTFEKDGDTIVLHVFKTDSGNTGIFGSKQLNDDLPKVTQGTMTYITFQGQVKAGKGKKNVYEIEMDDEIVLTGYVAPTVAQAETTTVTAAPAAETTEAEGTVDAVSDLLNNG